MIMLHLLRNQGKSRGAGGGKGLRFGGIWTGVIVTQVALTVAVPVHAYFIMRQATHVRSKEFRFPAQEY